MSESILAMHGDFSRWTKISNHGDAWSMAYIWAGSSAQGFSLAATKVGEQVNDGRTNGLSIALVMDLESVAAFPMAVNIAVSHQAVRTFQ